MISLGIYMTLMMVFFLICLKEKLNPLALLLVGYYTFISIVSYIAAKQGVLNLQGTSLFMYLFLIFAYLLYFMPFLNKSFGAGKVEYHLLEKFKPFCYVYIACSILTIYAYLVPLMQLTQSGNWAMARYSHYHEGNATVYTNIIERVGIAATIYFYLLAVIVGMLMLKEKKNTKLGVVLLVSAVASNYMQALYAVGRGTIFNQTLLLLALFIFISGGLGKSKKIAIIALGTLALIIIVPYMIEITQSRFTTNANSEMLRYFGEAPVVFNANVSTIDRLAWGKFALSAFFDSGFSQNAIGGSWGVRFYTFVGYVYIDWGMLGVMLFGVIFGLGYFYKKAHRSVYRISDVYLIFYYYQTLIRGGLVIGSSFLRDTVFALAVYMFLRYFMERIEIRGYGRLNINSRKI